MGEECKGGRLEDHTRTPHTRRCEAPSRILVTRLYEREPGEPFDSTPTSKSVSAGKVTPRNVQREWKGGAMEWAWVHFRMKPLFTPEDHA